MWNMFKVSNKYTCHASFWCLFCWFWIYFTPYCSISVVNFEHVIVRWDSFKLKKKLTENAFYQKLTESYGRYLSWPISKIMVCFIPRQNPEFPKWKNPTPINDLKDDLFFGGGGGGGGGGGKASRTNVPVGRAHDRNFSLLYLMFPLVII